MSISPSPWSSRLFDAERLNTLLGHAAGRFVIEALAECESTSTRLLQRAEAGAPSGSVIVADRQSAGRGSRGRSWMASPRASLTFSVLWRFPGGLERLSGLSLAVGVAVARALESCGAQGITLKWPNDVLLHEAKLAGILVEIYGEPEQASAVIGVGLNLHLPETLGDHAALMLPPAALADAVADLPERNLLLARLLAELASVFDRFSAGGFYALREEWHARHAWQDRPVRLFSHGRVEKEGICRGADEDGALIVETAAGIERCLSGDLSLRRQ